MFFVSRYVCGYIWITTPPIRFDRSSQNFLCTFPIIRGSNCWGWGVAQPGLWGDATTPMGEGRRRSSPLPLPHRTVVSRPILLESEHGPTRRSVIIIFPKTIFPKIFRNSIWVSAGHIQKLQLYPQLFFSRFFVGKLPKFNLKVL